MNERDREFVSALVCPQCGGPVKITMEECQWCGCGLVFRDWRATQDNARSYISASTTMITSNVTIASSTCNLSLASYHMPTTYISIS